MIYATSNSFVLAQLSIQLFCFQEFIMKNAQRLSLIFVVGGSLLAFVPTVNCQETNTGAAVAPSQVNSIRANSEKLAAAFNSGDAQAAAAMFLPNGELIDETGRLYQGQEEIQALMAGLFEQYPGVQVTLNTESVRPFGPAIIEEGTRTLTTAGEDSTSARFRYIDLWVQSESGLLLASHREFAEDPTPTPNDHLQSIAWLEGSWVNQGADGSVAIQFKWSESKNFMLGEFTMTDTSGAVRKSTQRIGWDPQAGHIRSWLFDADGGFSEGVWSVVDNGIIIKSTSVNPDGTDASATLTMTRTDEDQFLFAGSDRIIADESAPDFELTVTRSPPQPLSK
jgi:uncharacterized protein (TIGR02246 family)